MIWSLFIVNQKKKKYDLNNIKELEHFTLEYKKFESFVWMLIWK